MHMGSVPTHMYGVRLTLDGFMLEVSVIYNNDLRAIMLYAYN